MVKTYSPRQKEVSHSWYLVDAKDQTLGRLATTIARYLIGKHKVGYVPHLEMGDNVVVINASQIKVTGQKLTSKVYYHHSGYPGGLRERTLAEQLARDPRQVIYQAVKGMLPKNRLQAERLKRLKIFPLAQHNHTAQKPVPLPLGQLKKDKTSG